MKRVVHLVSMVAFVWWLLLIWVLWEITLSHSGLQSLALSHLPQSGVEHPVTAVLLNYRAYDTLLEVVVLLAAVLGVRAAGWPVALPLNADRGPLLPGVASLLLPLVLLSAVYLLWLGKHEAGGSFQAGALLGAAGVLALLAAPPGERAVRTGWVRSGLVIGFGGFLLIGLLVIPLTGTFLAYPTSWAGGLILTIEIILSLSIGLALLLLFAGDGSVVDPP